MRILHTPDVPLLYNVLAMPSPPVVISVIRAQDLREELMQTAAARRESWTMTSSHSYGAQMWHDASVKSQCLIHLHKQSLLLLTSV